MSHQIDRRHFLAAVASTVAASQYAFASSARAQGNASFTAVKQINAGLLNVGYVEAGPADGKPVILMHGWPYDIHAFVDVAPRLASAGCRVIIPHLRGYGTT